MKLLEYEAKHILAAHAVPVPNSVLITPGDKLPPTSVVLKSQVPVGGRGKAGGIRMVNKKGDATQAITELFHLPIKGHLPTVLLAEEKIAIAKEYYLSLLINRDDASVHIVSHAEGGVEVEDNDLTGFLDLPITNSTISECSAQISQQFGCDNSLLQPLLERLYNTFIDSDATLLEINPLILTERNTFVCGDCKMELDDAAAFRHPKWNFEDKLSDTNFVTLDPLGTVATIANGAGLAMATVDAVAAKGLIPANFLDIGGGANTASVLAAFEKIMEFPDIQAIIINIFAGITRCDEVARAIIAAKQQIDGLPPLFIRLAGTNFEEAVSLLSQEDITSLSTLEECLNAATEVIHAA